ncbi:MAG: hypothetical protein QXG65_00795 [Thermoplasmata archaeon]
MSLFSDVDWLIIAGVAAFLLFGDRNVELMRTFGRWYGRLTQMKQQMLTEVTRAADLPSSPLAGPPASLRAAFLGVDGAGAPRVSGIPAVVTTPPAVAFRTPSISASGWNGPGIGTPTWSVALPSIDRDPEAFR